ncbi:MAG: hypothetical protein B6242_17220 [Anaerolineaceae bacterium 4572_78]|nr:MAG: hypothetical protein B6242_17220 [Anaerolineaceae bacterium 4572_78]
MNIITPKNIENSTIREQYLNALLHMAELKKSEGAQSIKAILRIAAGALEIDKVSVWHVIEEMDMIIRQYLYESQSNHFSEKPITHNINERSPFLDTIRKNQVVIINNVHTDLARCEFIEKYLTSENIMALLYIPVWCYGQMISMLCCEQVNFEREWTEEDEKFAISVSNMLSITIEMTERYQTEQKLQEQQRFIENIANASPNILYVYNVLENNIQYISHSLYDILGYDVHEFQTMTLEQIISLIHQDDISLLSNHYAQLEQCDMGKVLEVEFRIHHKNGQWRWLYSSDLVFERTSDGRVSETLGSAQDITERKQIINELRQAKRTAELANRAKNEFLANITHE